MEDLLDRIVEDAAWCRGVEAVWERDCLLQPCGEEEPNCQGRMLIESALDFQDVLKEREQIGKKVCLCYLPHRRLALDVVSET